MAADSATKPPGFFSRLFRAPRRWTLPTRAAVLLAIGLAIMVLMAWLLFWLDTNSVPWRHAMTWWRITLDVALVVIIPVVVYHALRIWLEGEKSRFPDIDYAWKSGVEALAANGIPLDSAPIFLILGSGSETHEQDMLNASARSYRVEDVPAGPTALHWYASPDAIFLCCTDVGWLSALAELNDQREITTEPPAAPIAAAPTREVPSPAAAAPDPRAPQGTIMIDQLQDRSAASTSEATSPAPTETMAVGQTIRTPVATNANSDEPISLGTRDTAEQQERLQYLCRLLRRARQPVCGLNGVVTMLPVSLVQGPPTEVEQLYRAVKADLTTIQETVQLRCPTIALVSGLEEERGFRELVRRVGRDRATSQRFGQKFDVRRFSAESEMAAISAHVCGAFEDWVYALFREPGALSRPGNTHLYGLLCKVRCRWKTRLADILSHGFGYDVQRQPDNERFFFSGCYFAATGPSAARRAFVKAVIDKIVDENELIEWTDQALAESRRYRHIGTLGYLTTAALLIATVAAVAFRQF